MRSKALVRSRARVRTESEVNGARRARTSGAVIRPTGSGQLVARWVPAVDGRLQMRWERRYAPPILISRCRGKDA
jgi:hypothetical protein